jgi:hypothetical protein
MILSPEKPQLIKPSILLQTKAGKRNMFGTNNNQRRPLSQETQLQGKANIPWGKISKIIPKMS